MGIGVGVILIAEGAILAWAIDASTAGSHAQLVGYALLLLGTVGVLLSLVFWSSWAGPGYFARTDRLHRRW
jgi:hypothetical protein